jgi:hypothetical protein
MSEPTGQPNSPTSQPMPPPVAPGAYYQPAAFPQQQQWMPAPPTGYQPQPRNGYGVTALVLAIVGLVFGLVPFTGFLAIMCGGTSVLFGLLGLGRIRRHEATNKGLTITGLVLGALALLLGVIGLIIVMNAATKLSNDLSKIGKPSSAPSTYSYQQPQTPTWTVASTSPATPAAGGGEYGAGLYLVGTDIPAGTYHTDGPTSDDIVKLCIWQRKSNDSGDMSSIKASNMTAGANTVTAQAGEYLQLTGCRWTRR